MDEPVAPPDGPVVAFRHGVASGDPTGDAVVLWTRATTPGGRPAQVAWTLAKGPDLADVVARGVVVARPERDLTVCVDARGLEPATTYYYGFEAEGVASPVGRTRTAPVGPVANLRLGLVACASWPAGFFNAYARLAERDVDLVVHVGDYVYEEDTHHRRGVRCAGGARRHEPVGPPVTLADYRRRYAQYRTDPDLQRLHQQHPVVAVWDDHEVVANAWRDGAPAHRRRQGPFGDRRAAAVRAYFEWMPVRRPDPGDAGRVHRTVRLGDLADLVMIDTRLAGRDRPAAGGSRPVVGVRDRDRSLLGGPQRAWLRDELRASTARWRLVGNQVMMAPLRTVALPFVPDRMAERLGLVAGGAVVNAGQWDGYPGERAALFEHLRADGVDGVVVLTGDLHSSWAGELTLRPGEAGTAVGVEFVTPGVSADSFARLRVPRLPGARALVERLFAAANPHLRFFALDGHGYVVVDVTPERVQADWWHVATRDRPDAGERLVAAWRVPAGEARLVEAPGPLPARCGAVPAPAPPSPAVAHPVAPPLHRPRLRTALAAASAAGIAAAAVGARRRRR